MKCAHCGKETENAYTKDGITYLCSELCVMVHELSKDLSGGEED